VVVKVSLLKYVGHGTWKAVASKKAERDGRYEFKALPGKYKVAVKVRRGDDVLSNAVSVR
jgi:hypothetical protein